LIDEKEITVRIREEDLSVAKDAVKESIEELRKYGKNNNLNLDTTFFLAPSKADVKGLATWYVLSYDDNSISYFHCYFNPINTLSLLSYFNIHILSAGGVVLTAKQGKIVCDNTLDTRLKYAFDDLVPIIRKTLFEEPDRVPTVVEEKGHH
jgi:vacuolar-type H+-ATPase subunit E/Vma4